MKFFAIAIVKLVLILGVRMKQVRATSSDIRRVVLRARYAELMRLRAFVKRIEDSSGGHDLDIKLENELRRCFWERHAQLV
jgi:hypothetical protein